jgi:chemotaxis methyl-accepting protein methylase
VATDAIEGIESVLEGRVGLRLDPGLRTRIHRAVGEESAAAGLSLADYSSALDRDPELFQRLLNRITVQHTWFFRDPEVFDAVAAEVIPKGEEPIVAWSAGCSNGQEAYSLAMLLHESGRRDWFVIGTDVSTEAIRRANSGVYSAAEVTSLSARRLARHMRPAPGGWEVRPELRERTRFVHHNLTSDVGPVPTGSCSIVMCRNVLIYFNQEELARVLDRIGSLIRPDGYLFLGGAESLWRRSETFQLMRVGGAFAYRLSAAPAVLERRRIVQRVSNEMRRPASVSSLRGAAEAAAAAGDFAGAAYSLRQAAYLDPDQPVLLFQMALYLERAGRPALAQLALEASRSAIARCETSHVEAALEGFRPDELEHEIDRRLRRMA